MMLVESLFRKNKIIIMLITIFIFHPAKCKRVTATVLALKIRTMNDASGIFRILLCRDKFLSHPLLKYFEFCNWVVVVKWGSIHTENKKRSGKHRRNIPVPNQLWSKDRRHHGSLVGLYALKVFSTPQNSYFPHFQLRATSICCFHFILFLILVTLHFTNTH